MTLKGWEFYDDEGKTEATFFFRDCILDIWKEISDERLKEMKTYLEEHHEEIIKTIRHY